MAVSSIWRVNSVVRFFKVTQTMAVPVRLENNIPADVSNSYLFKNGFFTTNIGYLGEREFV